MMDDTAPGTGKGEAKMAHIALGIWISLMND